MFKKVVTISTLTVCLTLSANDDVKTLYNTGQRASLQLMKTLGKNLKKEMKTNGIYSAIDFCRTNAYKLTEQVNQSLKKGVSVKRISLKFRNPANRPEQDEIKILQAIENNFKTTPKGVLQEVKSGEYKFYKPLTIAKPVCLKCHGNSNQIPEKVQNFLKNNYPFDKATNYKMHDIRGAIVVEIKKVKE